MMPPCSTCGAPSTHCAVDVLALSPILGFPQFMAAPNAPIRWGCNEHPVKSEVIGPVTSAEARIAEVLKRKLDAAEGQS